MKKNIWIFGSRKGQTYDDNSKYLFEYAVENLPMIDAFWITRNTTVYEYLKNKNKPVLMYHGTDTKEIITNAQYAFINITYADIGSKDLLQNIKVIQLWHGTPMKKNNIAIFNEAYHFVSLASLEFLTSQALGTRELFDFKLTGYPRNDILLDEDLTPSYLSSKTIQILKQSNIISFLPTYNEEKDPNKQSSDKRGKYYNIWEGFDFQNFEEFLRTTNSIFIFKPHILQSIEDSHILQKMQKSDKFILVDHTNPMEDIYEYLKYTDILLTDYSSVLFDFLLLEKPIIFTSFNLDDYLKKRGLRFDYHDITPGKKVCTWDETLKELKTLIIDNIDTYKLQRMEVNHRFNYYKDINSSKRISQLLLQD